MQIRKRQLELNMEQQTGSKSGMEYIKAVYCHSAYLTYMQIGWLVGLVAKSCLTLATPQTVACQAPLSIGFSTTLGQTCAGNVDKFLCFAGGVLRRTCLS